VSEKLKYEKHMRKISSNQNELDQKNDEEYRAKWYDEVNEEDLTPNFSVEDEELKVNNLAHKCITTINKLMSFDVVENLPFARQNRIKFKQNGHNHCETEQDP